MSMPPPLHPDDEFLRASAPSARIVLFAALALSGALIGLLVGWAVWG